MFKVIIAGGRDFNNYEKLKRCCIRILSSITDEIEIVSGGARGADKLGENFAKEMGYKLKIFEADWNGLGKKAGHIRNGEMAKYADALIAFHDGNSPGTADMIRTAETKRLKSRVIYYR